MNDKTYTFPLSNAQERIWILSELYDNKTVYNVPVAFDLIGDLNVDALFKSIEKIIDRHEILRTSFKVINNIPLQIISPSIKLQYQDFVVDILSGNNEELQRQIDSLSQLQIDLLTAPVFNIKLLRLSGERSVLFINFHHIIVDEWSIGVFFHELKEFYEEYSSGREPVIMELPIQYGDYAVWQREWLESDALNTQLNYWKEKLNGLEEFELPADRLRGAMPTFKGEMYRTRLSEVLTKKLRNLARRKGVTLNMLLLTAFKVLLYRYTQQEDIAVGIPIANRNRIELEGLIGFLVNTLVIRTDLFGELTFEGLLWKVKEGLLEAYDHQDLPFDRLVEELNPERDQSRMSLFQVMFVMGDENLGVDEMGGVKLQPRKIDTGTSKFDLTMFVGEGVENLSVSFEYSTDLFDADRIRRMAAHYERILTDIVERPEKKIQEIELLTEAEKHHIMDGWNGTLMTYPEDKCVHQLFEEQVERTPDAVAVVFGKDRLTYRELNERANQLGHHLQKLGVGPNIMVGICVERSLEMIIGLLGILKAGGVYVPMDPAYPKERLEVILKDANARVLLSHKKFVTHLSVHDYCPIVYLDEWRKLEREKNENIISEVVSENLLYVIYTSGSTGEPKGAGVYHTGFVNLLNWFVTEHHLNNTDSTLLLSSFSFDLTQKNIFAPLIIGGKLYLLTSEHYDPDFIINQINHNSITWINCTPSAFYPLVDQDTNILRGNLKFVFLGGEPIVISRLYKWMLASEKVKIVNTYGPTECTDISSSFIIQSGDALRDEVIPIGKEIYNVKQFILDKNLKLLPVGIPGELYIGGKGVGAGYIGRPSQTAEKFIPNPFNSGPNTRIYKTGDMARMLPDGNIQFLGRLDHQVKIRGYRIELGEIESIITNHPAVKETVVGIRTDLSGNQYLIAYLVVKYTTTSLELKQFVQKKLPNYMVPSTFLILDALPLNRNGKVDRKALMKIDIDGYHQNSDYIAPRTEIEKRLANIWEEVLGVKKVGVNDNFFDLGGNSLSLVIMIAKARQYYIPINLNTIYTNGTIAGITRYVSGVIPVPGTNKDSVSERFPLLPTQSHFFQRIPRDQDKYFIIGSLFEVNQEVDLTVLEDAVNKVLIHHSGLSTRFFLEENCQEYCQVSNDIVTYLKIDNGAQDEINKFINNTALQLMNKIDIQSGLLIQVAFFQVESIHINYVLILVSHYVMDWISWDILLNDINNLYFQLIKDKSNALLPKKTTSILDYAKKINYIVETGLLHPNLQYWLDIDLQTVSQLEVVNDDKNPGLSQFTVYTHENQLFDELVNINKGRFVLSDIILTAFAKSYKDTTKQSSLLFRMSNHGRASILDDVDLSQTVGLISNAILVYFDLNIGNDLSGVLENISSQIKKIPNQGTLCLAARYLEQGTYLSQKINKLYDLSEINFNLMFSTGNKSKTSIFSERSNILKLPEINFQGAHRKLSLGVMVENEKIISKWSYDTRFLTSSDIMSFASIYSDTLTKLFSWMAHERYR